MIADVVGLRYYLRENNMEDQKIKIEEFNEYLKELEVYDDEKLNRIMKICLNSLFIMYQEGYEMPRKTLLELQKNL